MVDAYEAVAALPDLDAKTVASATGLRNPTRVTGTTASGKGWRTSVEHSQFVTRVQAARDCAVEGSDQPDADTAIEQAQDVFTRLGGDPDTQTWFTVPGKQGDDRVYAEPNLDGAQTWSTGIYVARVDERGVCALSASLMAFEPTGATTTFASPEEAFVAVDGGTYAAVEQTYTLGSGGRLTPVWRFTGEGRSDVVVDLGDGLESAPDTKTYLTELAAG